MTIFGMPIFDVIMELLKLGLVFMPLSLIPVLIFLERKGAAVIQDRVGPNRASIPVPGVGAIRGFGMVHNFSDVVKLLFKEDFVPKHAHKLYYILGPAIPVATAVLTPALIPWFAPIGDINGSFLSSHVSLLLLFAFGAIGIYGTVLGSWGSNSKMSLFGGLRASAMMISYEVAMGLSILGMILIVGSFDLAKIVGWQAEHTWGIFVQPVGFLLFVTAMFAETGRTPFDVKEGESEIVGGFHTEYSSMKFAAYFMAEYAHIVVASALIATVFLGGFDLLPIPGVGQEFISSNLGYILAVGLAGKAVLLAILGGLVKKQRKHYLERKPTDASAKDKEYKLFTFLFYAGSIGCIIAAACSALFIGSIDIVALGTAVDNEAATLAEGETAWYAIASGAVALLTAGVQIGALLAKILFFCWVFVWVRWTLPRLRYDQVMHLGWKIMLNVALVNLLITAAVLQFLGKGN